ncbi:diguanylate cyclase domain-containing protein [Kineococcus sp. SYSU DK005]|uniref:diguanylate cyclase domain-containing protein n=1 Tax=Kineococcus sp. SYSU DK005 TaxID=3383126 RepID=UPI003D7E5AED
MEQTRRLYCLLVLLSAALLVPPVVRSAEPVAALLFAATTAALGGVWVHRYATRRARLAGDVVEALLLAACTALASPSTLALGTAFPALWFRAVYGSTRRVWLHCAGAALGLLAGLPFWSAVPGHHGPGTADAVLGCVPLLLLTTAGARHLANGLFAREQAQHRDAALGSLGRDLLTLRERDEITGRGVRAATEVCGSTPGLVSVLVEVAPDGARPLATTGTWVLQPPPVLTGVVLPARPRDDRPVLLTGTGLDALLPGAEWIALPNPGREGAWLLVGARGRLAAEGVPALRAVMTQVVLALRNSDAHRALAEQARTDALTGLANRTAFTEALAAAAHAASARFSVAFVDLDDFKAVNDGRGHAAGDELLRAVAARLRATVRAGDLCARLGGDEFAVLLRDPDEPAVADLAERVVEAVVQPVELPGGPVRVGASVGVAHRRPGEDAEQVVQHADVAMYAAKAAGKNRVRVFAA